MSPQEILDLLFKKCEARGIPGQKRQNRFAESPVK